MVDCGSNRSGAKDEWVRHRFDVWRKLNGFDCSVQSLDYKVLNDMLCRFFLQVVKLDGTLYPVESIMGMFCCFDRMSRKEQDIGVANSGILEEVVDIMKNPFFQV